MLINTRLMPFTMRSVSLVPSVSVAQHCSVDKKPLLHCFCGCFSSSLNVPETTISMFLWSVFFFPECPRNHYFIVSMVFFFFPECPRIKHPETSTLFVSVINSPMLNVLNMPAVIFSSFNLSAWPV